MEKKFQDSYFNQNSRKIQNKPLGPHDKFSPWAKAPNLYKYFMRIDAGYLKEW